MQTQIVIPDCVMQTLAPNPEMKLCWDQTIGVEDLKHRLLTHMKVCFDPTSLFSWHRRHYKKEFIEPRYRRRVLLIGPPGTGKTTVAIGCIDRYARLTKSEIYLIELGLVRSKFEGEPSRNIQRVFRYITELSQDRKVAFFADEFDSKGPSRGVEQMHDSARAMVNTLNSEMNKLNTPNVFTIAASNFEGYIDHAVKRRFDFILYFRRPTFYQRVKLLRHLLRPYNFLSDGIREMAKKTKGYTQDDITRTVYAAVEEAFSRNKPLSFRHLVYGLSVVKPTGEYKDWR